MNMSSRHYIRLGFLVAIALTSTVIVSAQSGRRSAKPADKTMSPPQKKVSLLVSIEDRNPFSNIPYYLADSALDECIDRLRDATEISVSSSARGMTRADAVRRAKSEKEIYVVWLQIQSPLPESAKQPKNGPEELYLRYTIFEPATARIKAEARAHQSIYRMSAGGVSSQTSARSSPIYSEYALKQAAREAGELVMRAFEITPPEERVPR